MGSCLSSSRSASEKSPSVKGPPTVRSSVWGNLKSLADGIINFWRKIWSVGLCTPQNREGLRIMLKYCKVMAWNGSTWSCCLSIGLKFENWLMWEPMCHFLLRNSCVWNKCRRKRKPPEVVGMYVHRFSSLSSLLIRCLILWIASLGML